MLIQARSLGGFESVARPAEDMRRIVVFNPNEERPRFMWAKVDTYEDDEGVVDYETVKSPTYSEKGGVQESTGYGDCLEITRNAWT